MLGSIYIIKNTINDKVYIGQTVQSLNDRFKQHKTASLKGGKTKLYKAMQEYGTDVFYIELIGTYDVIQLTQKEIDNIIKYDSIHNGYNSVIPVGDVLHTSRFNECIEDIIDMYLGGSTYNEIALRFNTSRNSVAKLCSDLSYIRVENKTRSKSNSTGVVAYTRNYEPIAGFYSIKKVGEYLVSNGFKTPEKDLRNLYNYINAACQRDNIAYGFRWQYYEDLLYEDKVFRTKFDKEAYIQGGIAYQPDGKKYFVCDGALDNKIVSNEKDNKCIICGNIISRDATLCRGCYTNKLQHNIPDKETLQELILKYSYEEIGRQYNVTGKSVRKWCNKYNIAKTLINRDDSGVQIIETGISFGKFRDAAIYLINNGYSSSNNISGLAYRISQSKKNGTALFGLHFK